MKYIVILLLIIVLIFLFNIKEPWKDSIKPVEGKLTEPDLSDPDNVINFILSNDEYKQKIKNNIVNNYKLKFKNLGELSKSLENVDEDVNKQLKKIFIEEVSKTDDLNLVDFITKEVKKDTNLIKGAKGDKGFKGVLTSNPEGEVLAKSLNIGANKPIDSNFVKQFNNTDLGDNPIISKSNVYVGDIKTDDVLTNSLFADNIYIGDKHIKSKNITDVNNNPISAINFGNELHLNTLKLGSNEVKEADNNLQLNSLTSNVLDVNKLTVNNTEFKDIKQRGNKGDTGDRGLSSIGGSIYQSENAFDFEGGNGGGIIWHQKPGDFVCGMDEYGVRDKCYDIHNYYYRLHPDLTHQGNVDFNFSDGKKKTIKLYGKPDYDVTVKGVKGNEGDKGEPGIRGDDLTSGSFNKTTGKFTLNDREKTLTGSLPKGDTGVKGDDGETGSNGYSISPANSSISDNTLILVNNNNEEKQQITLPILKGLDGVDGSNGINGTDFESQLFDKIVEQGDTIEFGSDSKFNKNLCFKTSEDNKFCFNKKSFRDNFSRMRNILNKLGVINDSTQLNSQSESIIRLNGAKLGYNYVNIEDILNSLENDKNLKIFSKLKIKLNDMSFEEALNKVEYFIEILDINQSCIIPKMDYYADEVAGPNSAQECQTKCADSEGCKHFTFFQPQTKDVHGITHEKGKCYITDKDPPNVASNNLEGAFSGPKYCPPTLKNDDIIAELDKPYVKERKQLLEKILYVDDLYNIDLPKSEINKRIKDFFCKSKLLGYDGSSELCPSDFKLNSFNDIETQYNQKTHRQKSEVIAKREEADRQRREAAAARAAADAEIAAARVEAAAARAATDAKIAAWREAEKERLRERDREEEEKKKENAERIKRYLDSARRKALSIFR